MSKPNKAEKSTHIYVAYIGAIGGIIVAIIGLIGIIAKPSPLPDTFAELTAEAIRTNQAILTQTTAIYVGTITSTVTPTPMYTRTPIQIVSTPILTSTNASGPDISMVTRVIAVPNSELTYEFISVDHGQVWVGRNLVTTNLFAVFLNSRPQRSSSRSLVDDKRIADYSASYWQLSFDDFWTIMTEFDADPIVGVTWYGARDFCDYIGGEIASEYEWRTVVDENLLEYSSREITTVQEWMKDWVGGIPRTATYYAGLNRVATQIHFQPANADLAQDNIVFRCSLNSN